MVSRREEKRDIPVALKFHAWLVKQQKESEPALEDTLRRLAKYKARKRIKSKVERSLIQNKKTVK